MILPVEVILAEVAGELEWIVPPPVFIGGATVGLFLDETGRAQMRPTKDVDCIVPAVTTAMEWFTLEAELRRRGWQPDMEGPICRYRSPSGHRVDLLAVRPEVQGFTGTWFEATVREAQVRVVEGRTLRVASSSHLLANKIEAFRDRGTRDPPASQDLEDIVALLDGCEGLLAELGRASPGIQSFVAGWARETLASPDLFSIAEAQLPHGGDDAGRRERLRETFTALAAPPAQSGGARRRRGR